MAYRRFYITGGLSIVGLFLLIAPFIEYYYNYQDVVYCDERCWVEFCMKNGATTLYFYNKEQLPLTFSPKSEIKSVEFFKKDSRFKSGYKKIDFITPYSAGASYVFKIDAFKTSCYAMKIVKGAKADVKWTFIGLDPWLLSTPQGNLTYDVNSCYNLTSTKDSLGNCFTPNWSIAYNQVNWSNNRTIHSGNYSWNFTQLNITNTGDFLFNFTNNGTTNITIRIKLNTTNMSKWYLHFWNGSFDKNISSTSFVSLINLTNGTSRRVNFSLNLYNISQTYVNWTLNYSTANWNFNYTLNITSYT